MSKPHTANELDERFQWREPLDPDHIFPEEYEMIKQLRSEVPQLEAETDKFAAIFLFARRHDMKECKKLVENFYKKKDKYSEAFDGHHFPTFKYTKILQTNRTFGGMPMLQPKGYRDKMGRMLRIMQMELDRPSLRSLELMYAICFWHIYYLVATEPLNAWRNGTMILLDMKNIGWHNFDLSSKGRDLSKALQGVFPNRIRSIVLVNGGGFLNALVTAAKLVLPKKMMQRVTTIHVEELKNLIPEDYLVPRFGGESKEFSFPEYYKEIADTEDELFAKGIWKVPHNVVSTNMDVTTTVVEVTSVTTSIDVTTSSSK